MSRVVVVTGSRHTTDRALVWDALDARHAENPFEYIGIGDAPGVDALALAWAKARNVPHMDGGFVAYWRLLGNAAGPIRNGKMLRTVQPDAVLAFPGGTGTADCVRQARAMGFTVFDALTGEELPE